MSDKTDKTDWTESVNVRLSNGEYLRWAEDKPQAFRKIVSAKAAMRLVKLASTVEIYNPTMEFVRVQKGDMLDTLKGLSDGFNIACEFDGEVLTILGTV